MCAGRRWLQVGRLPILPIAPLSRYVECVSCQSTYAPALLTRTEPAASSDEDVLTTVLRHAAVAILHTGSDPIDSRRHRRAVIVLQRYANRPYGAHDLDRDLTDLASDEVVDRLAVWSSQLNDRGRSIVLDASLQLAPDADIVGSQYRATITEIARALAIPAARVRAALDTHAVPAAG